MLRDAPRTDHFHVLIHQTARACGVAHLDERDQLFVHAQDSARHVRCERRILRRPGDVLQRYELHHQHTIVRGFGDRKVKFPRQARVADHILDLALRLCDQPAQPRMILGGGVDGSKLGRKAFDGALRLHDLGDGHAGKIELDGESFRKQPCITRGDSRAAARTDFDLDDSLRFERPQRVARDDAAHRKALGQILLGAQKIAGTQLFREQRVAYLSDDPGR